MADRVENGYFAPGNKGGPGRPKGAENKLTKEMRQKIKDLLDDEFENLQTTLKNLDPKDRIDVYVKLLEFAVPKLTRTEVRDMTSIEELMQMDREQRLARMAEIKRQLNQDGK